MKKSLFGILASFVICISFTASCSPAAPAMQEKAPLTPEQDWEAFIDAIAWKESRWDVSAVGRNQDVGYLQITPILVSDVNRILGQERYTLDDRYDPEKSVEMFNIIQNHYNPSRDKATALRVWNRHAPESYQKEIFDMYSYLISEVE